MAFSVSLIFWHGGAAFIGAHPWTAVHLSPYYCE